MLFVRPSFVSCSILTDVQSEQLDGYPSGSKDFKKGRLQKVSQLLV
jgi:hypothetical protein